MQWPKIMNTSRKTGDDDWPASGIWLCLHFAQLPIEVFCRDRKDHPVVVSCRQKIQYMNQSASLIGIKSGNSMDTAYTVTNQIVNFERDEEKEFATLSHLAQWAYQFTPCVSIKAPHSLLLDVSGCLKLFLGLPNLVQEVRSGLARLGYSAAIGISVTPLAALCFAEACFAEAERGIDKNVVDSFDNTIISKVADSLQQVPVNALRIDKKIEESLQQMGIHTVGSLLALPTDGLSRRFGIFFADYLQRLVGEKPDPQKFIGEDPRFHSDITFLSDVTNIQSLAFPVKRLIAELCDFLQVRQLQLNHLVFKLSHRCHPAKQFSIYLANPENDAAMFLMLTQLQLDKINDMPEVDNISLSANSFSQADAHSGDLFHGTSFRQKDGRLHNNSDRDRTSRLLNMFRARLGPQTCFGLSLANDHRPEKAWKTVRLNKKDYWFPEKEDRQNQRPLYLLNKPRFLLSTNGRPNMEGTLDLTLGPERIDFGWWDGNDAARDYYVARQSCGAHYWVYQDMKTREWFLHGIFS